MQICLSCLELQGRRVNSHPPEGLMSATLSIKLYECKSKLSPKQNQFL